MDSSKIRSRVSELNSIIKRASEEIEIIQKICKHEDKKVINYSWHPGSFVHKYKCENCGEILDECPSIEEIKKEAEATGDYMMLETCRSLGYSMSESNCDTIKVRTNSNGKWTTIEASEVDKLVEE